MITNSNSIPSVHFRLYAPSYRVWHCKLCWALWSAARPHLCGTAADL